MKSTTFTRIKLTRPKLAPVSRLYCLEPIGLGTPSVESLTSFIARLALEHGVTTGVLFTWVIAKEIGKPYLTVPRRHANQLIENTLTISGATRRRSINGCGQTAIDFVCALERLCKRKDLRFLTMLHWSNLLNKNSLLRKNRSWCPNCYEAQRESGTVHDQLLWFLLPTTICTTHNNELSTKCPSCGGDQPVLTHRLRPGYCSKCDSWLGLNSTTERTNTLEWSDPDLGRENRFAISLGHFLSAVESTPSPSRETFTNAIESAIQRATSGNAAAFARCVGRNKNVIFGWQRGKCRIPIGDLVDVCDRLSISIVDFITSKEVQLRLREDLPSKARKRATAVKRNWKEIESELERIIDKKELLSLKEVERRLKCHVRTLRDHFPALICEISSRWIKHLRRCRQERETQNSKEIRRVAVNLHENGVYPSGRAVKAQLNVHVDYYIVNIELRKIHAELGLTHRFGHVRKLDKSYR